GTVVVSDIGVDTREQREMHRSSGIGDRAVNETRGLAAGLTEIEGDFPAIHRDLHTDLVRAIGVDTVIVDPGFRGVLTVRELRYFLLDLPGAGLKEFIGRGTDRIDTVLRQQRVKSSLADGSRADLAIE